MSYSSQDYDVSDREACRVYANWKIAQNDELRKAEAKFAPESIPKMADRLLEHTNPNDLKHIKKGIRESIAFVYFVILSICFSVLMFSSLIIPFSFMNALGCLLILAILAALITLLGYCRYRQTLFLRAFEYYVWFALQHYRLALDEMGFYGLKNESSLNHGELQHLVSSYEEALGRLVPKYNLSRWDRHLSHGYTGPARIIVQSSWRRLFRGAHRHLSEEDQILRERLLRLADLWYLGLRDFQSYLAALYEDADTIKKYIEIETLYRGAILFKNFKDADHFGLQLQASRQIKTEQGELTCLRWQQVIDNVQPYREQVDELDMLAGRIATLKVKYQTSKALDGLSWRQKDLRHLLDLEESKFDLELSRLELNQKSVQV